MPGEILAQREIADICGCSRSLIHQIEEKKALRKMREKICKEFGMSFRLLILHCQSHGPFMTAAQPDLFFANRAMRRCETTCCGCEKVLARDNKGLDGDEHWNCWRCWTGRAARTPGSAGCASWVRAAAKWTLERAGFAGPTPAHRAVHAGGDQPITSSRTSRRAQEIDRSRGIQHRRAAHEVFG